MDKNLQLKIALMGDGDVVVTPCRGPPAPEAVKAWAREKLIKREVKKQGTDPALKNSEPRSNDGNLDKVENSRLSEQRNMNSNVSKSPKLELDLAIPEASTSKIHLQEVTRKSCGPSVDPELESLVDNKRKVTEGVASDKKTDVMQLSESSSPAEITSPGSLFSPNEGSKTFTFASGSPKETASRKSVECTHNENQFMNEISGTQPMNIDNNELSPQFKDDVSSRTSPVTVTPSGKVTQSATVTQSILHSPDGTPQQSPSTTKQPLSPLLQTQSPVFAAPYHSTPVAAKLVYGVQSPRCTPISDAVKVKRLETSVETSGKINLGHQAASDQTPSLRQQLLASQFKVALLLNF